MTHQDLRESRFYRDALDDRDDIITFAVFTEHSLQFIVSFAFGQVKMKFRTTIVWWM